MPRDVERLADIDVAEPRDDALIEQHRLDRRDPAGERRRQHVGVEIGAERLGAERARRRASRRAARSRPDRASRSGADRRATAAARRRSRSARWSCAPKRLGIDPPAPRHAEMEDQRVAAIGVDQPIFGAPPQPGHARAGQPLAQVRRERRGADRRGAARRASAARPSSTLRQAAHGGLDFGKLGHIRRRS